MKPIHSFQKIIILGRQKVKNMKNLNNIINGFNISLHNFKQTALNLIRKETKCYFQIFYNYTKMDDKSDFRGKSVNNLENITHS